MKATKSIRQIFDLTQQQLADYLGVSRSRLALAETGRRDLPVSALIRLAGLEKSLHNNISYKQQHLHVQAGKDLAAMRRHAKACQHKARAAKMKLDELQQNYQHCVMALMAVDQLLNNLLPAKENRKDQLWLELLLAQTLKKLNRCGPAAQVKIKLTMQALEMQAAQAEAMKF